MEYKYYIKGRHGKVFACSDNGECIVNNEYPNLTDNQCEWTAIVDTLKYIYNTFGDSERTFFICLDSKLVFKQLMSKVGSDYTGKTYSIKSQTLHPIYLEWNKLKNLLWDTTIKYLYVEDLKNIARKRLKNDNNW